MDVIILNRIHRNAARREMDNDVGRTSRWAKELRRRPASGRGSACRIVSQHLVRERESESERGRERREPERSKPSESRSERKRYRKQGTRKREFLSTLRSRRDNRPNWGYRVVDR